MGVYETNDKTLGLEILIIDALIEYGQFWYWKCETLTELIIKLGMLAILLKYIECWQNIWWDMECGQYSWSGM